MDLHEHHVELASLSKPECYLLGFETAHLVHALHIWAGEERLRDVVFIQASSTSRARELARRIGVLVRISQPVDGRRVVSFAGYPLERCDEEDDDEE